MEGKNNLDTCSAILISSIFSLRNSSKRHTHIFVVQEVSLLASDNMGKLRKTDNMGKLRKKFLPKFSFEILTRKTNKPSK